MNDNKLIAEFMGVNVITLDDVRKNKNPYFSSADGYLEDDLKYHTSWDWLMPVVRRIVSDIELDLDYENEYREHLMDVVPFARIEDVYEAVVEFIKIHNDKSNFLCGSCGEECSEYTYSEDRDVDECNDCKTSNDEQQ